MENEMIDDTLKEKLKNCKDKAEMRKVIAESGMELSDDVLDAVSGGLFNVGDCFRH